MIPRERMLNNIQMLSYLQRLESPSPTAVTCLLCDIKRKAAATPETLSSDIMRQVESFYSESKHISLPHKKSAHNVDDFNVFGRSVNVPRLCSREAADASVFDV